jgi:hypothetical protein
MNQPTHAMLAVEAYRKIAAASKTPEGKKNKLPGLERLLGANLKDVVVAAWLPDALIKDMLFGHVFKNSRYIGDQSARFSINKEDLKKHLADNAQVPKVAFDLVPDPWWSVPYRVKDNGGHLPARVNALSQTVRDMFKMGDSDVVALTGIKSKGSEIVAKNILFSPRNIATNLWMMSHYIADAHMPFHCDNRALASTAKQKTHGKFEDLWGKQVSMLFHTTEILKKTTDEILAAKLPTNSKFAGIDYGQEIPPLKNSGDPWKEAVYICRVSFASSYALVPPNIAEVDNQDKEVSLEDILSPLFCGETRFWDISRAIMTDAVNSIAMFWQDAWLDFVRPKKSEE